MLQRDEASLHWEVCVTLRNRQAMGDFVRSPCNECFSCNRLRVRNEAVETVKVAKALRILSWRGCRRVGQW